MSEAIVGGHVETLERRPMSWEEYLALPEKPRTEWVDGEAVIMTPGPTTGHQWVSRRLANLLEGRLPELFVLEAINVKLPRNRVRIPDIVVLREREDVVFVESAPELVVEILSPSTRSEDVFRKATDYAAGGIGQYWLLDLAGRALDVLELLDGAWEPVLRLDEIEPRGSVRVGEHGVVPLDLARLIDG